jgi:hypothetical protein
VLAVDRLDRGDAEARPTPLADVVGLLGDRFAQEGGEREAAPASLVLQHRQVVRVRRKRGSSDHASDASIVRTFGATLG